MNWNVTISIVLVGLILSRKIVPKILYMMEDIALRQARISTPVELVKENGEPWVGASPTRYTYQPKR